MWNYANALGCVLSGSRCIPFHCYRVLKILMHHYCKKCRKREDCRDWNKVHANLGTNKCTIKWYADKARHGGLFNESDYGELEIKVVLKYVLQAFVIKQDPWTWCEAELRQLDSSRLPENMTPECSCTASDYLHTHHSFSTNPHKP